MAQVAAYHRPQDLDGAIELLAGPGRTALAGGTILNADREPPAIEVVDLQALGLDSIEPTAGGRLRLGAMVTLDRLADRVVTDADGLLPAWLAGLARGELPSTLRTLATVGGTVAAGGGESALLAGLLAADAIVELAGHAATGPPGRPLTDVLASGLTPGSLVTAVTVDVTGSGAVAATGRTPADVPIVAAIAAAGTGGETRLALSGVADQPVLVDPSDPPVGLDPPGDFRGSAAYRRHLAEVLSARALEAVRV
ncbi:MAG: FAD binding domain-containing protein [Actinomycetota bacterium]